MIVTIIKLYILNWKNKSRVRTGVLQHVDARDTTVTEALINATNAQDTNHFAIVNNNKNIKYILN